MAITTNSEASLKPPELTRKGSGKDKASMKTVNFVDITGQILDRKGTSKPGEIKKVHTRLTRENKEELANKSKESLSSEGSAEEKLKYPFLGEQINLEYKNNDGGLNEERLALIEKIESATKHIIGILKENQDKAKLEADEKDRLATQCVLGLTSINRALSTFGLTNYEINSAENQSIHLNLFIDQPINSEKVVNDLQNAVNVFLNQSLMIDPNSFFDRKNKKILESLKFDIKKIFPKKPKAFESLSLLEVQSIHTLLKEYRDHVILKFCEILELRNHKDSELLAKKQSSHLKNVYASVCNLIVKAQYTNIFTFLEDISIGLRKHFLKRLQSLIDSYADRILFHKDLQYRLSPEKSVPVYFESLLEAFTHSFEKGFHKEPLNAWDRMLRVIHFILPDEVKLPLLVDAPGMDPIEREAEKNKFAFTCLKEVSGAYYGGDKRVFLTFAQAFAEVMIQEKKIIPDSKKSLLENHAENFTKLMGLATNIQERDRIFALVQTRMKQLFSETATKHGEADVFTSGVNSVLSIAEDQISFYRMPSHQYVIHIFTTILGVDDTLNDLTMDHHTDRKIIQNLKDWADDQTKKIEIRIEKDGLLTKFLFYRRAQLGSIQGLNVVQELIINRVRAGGNEPKEKYIFNFIYEIPKGLYQNSKNEIESIIQRFEYDLKRMKYDKLYPNFIIGRQYI